MMTWRRKIEKLKDPLAGDWFSETLSDTHDCQKAGLNTCSIDENYEFLQNNLLGAIDPKSQQSQK